MNKSRCDTCAWTPLRIVLAYTLFGGLWILFSDTIVLRLTQDPAILSRLQTYKGWFFILVTAMLLFGLINRMISHGQKTINDLRHAEDYNRTLFDLSPIGLVLCTMDGHLLDINPAYAAIIGRTVDETMHLTYWDITPEKYAEQEQAQLASLRAIGRYGPYEKEYIHKDGHLVPVRLLGMIIEKGGEQCIWSSVEDITERKQAESALRLSEEKFAKTFRNSPDAIALTSLPGGKFVEINDSFLRLSGYSLNETIGCTTLDLHLWVSQDDRQHYVELLQKNGRVKAMETDFRKKSGEIMRSLISGEVIQLQGRAYILNVIFDITERKRTEEELLGYREHLEDLVRERTMDLDRSRVAMQNLLEDVNEAKKALEAANAKLLELDRLKSMFIASMSHELRTPLNSIIGFTGILLQGLAGDINDEQRDQLQRVYRAGKHLLSLITDVIDIAKIESGKIHAVVEEFSLAEVIDEACDSMKVQMADKGLALIKIVPKVPIRMRSDRRRLLQCLLNFLSNAVKFSEKGRVTIEVTELQVSEYARLRRDRGAEGGEFVEISVSDTGVGIKQEDMSKLFQSFVRLESSLKIIVPGTALGLYLTKKLATEVLGGEVAAESSEGEGSIFRLRLPVELDTKAEVSG